MDKKQELEFLQERYKFRMGLFCEWCFVDNRLISDAKQFSKDTNEIMEKIIKLKEEVSP